MSAAKANSSDALRVRGPTKPIAQTFAANRRGGRTTTPAVRARISAAPARCAIKNSGLAPSGPRSGCAMARLERPARCSQALRVTGTEYMAGPRRSVRFGARIAGLLVFACSISVRRMSRRQTVAGSGSNTESVSAGTTCQAPVSVSRSSVREPIRRGRGTREIEWDRFLTSASARVARVSQPGRPRERRSVRL